MATVLDQPREVENSPQHRAQDVLRRFVSRIQADRRFYFERCLQIKTKSNRIVPLVLNKPQEKVQVIIDRLRREGKPVRLIILKARQEGMSTLTEANIFHATTTKPFVNSMIVAHDTDSAYEIFSMSRLYYDMLPPEVKPMTKYSNRKELVFQNPDDRGIETTPGLRSKLLVDTAANARIGRAFTIHHFHGSEVAFWDKPDDVMLGVSQAVPDAPDTSIVLESTANGLGGYFYDAYMAAQRGESDFEDIFLAWFEMDEYQRPIGVGDWNASEYKTFEESLDADEIQVRERYDLTLEQVNWRRWAIRNKCGIGSIDDRKDKFRQEYPANDAECFLVSGQTVFNVQVIKDHYLPKTERPTCGYLKLRGDSFPIFEENAAGPFSFWQEPLPGRHYLIGCDVAEGLEEGDASVGEVYDRISGEFVAQYWGHPDPDLFAKELYMLGFLFNEAWIAVESNNHGISTLLTLRNGSSRHGIKPYKFLYYKEVYDERTKRRTKKLGWRTDRVSKPIIIDNFVEQVRDFLVKIPDKEMCRELLTYVRNAEGKMDAIPGTLDDRVMAGAIALYCHSQLPMIQKKRPVKKSYQHRRTRTGY